MNIGNVKLENNVFLAPMAGVTDLPFRVVCKGFGAGLVYSEMVSAKALHYGDKKTAELLKTSDAEAPLCVQIFGSDPAVMAEGAQKALSTGAKIVDINMGCPAPKVANNGDGSSLLKDVELIGKIVRAVSDAAGVPVTCKIRSGFDEVADVERIAKTIEQSGAAAIAVHPRTRKMYYSGHSDWNIIADVKKAVSIPVIGNGDIDSPQRAAEAFDRYGVDGVMIGRATYGRPWIFREIRHYLDTDELLPQPSVCERVEIAKRHLAKSVEVKGERVGVLEMRRHLSNYFKGLPDFKPTRLQLVTLTDVNEINATLDYIAQEWGGADLSGAVPPPLSHGI